VNSGGLGRAAGAAPAIPLESEAALPAADADAAPQVRHGGDDRRLWVLRRGYMERHGEKRMPDGKRHTRQWPLFNFLIRRFGEILWCLGLYRRGVRNALDIRLNRFDVEFAGLPAEFDGFTILLLADLHLDGIPELTQRAVDLIGPAEPDICVMSGDYRFHIRGEFKHVLPALERLLAAARPRQGHFAILGNHDTVEMIEPFRRLGATILSNDVATFRRGGAELHLLGVDDVHYYYTEHARGALELVPDGFTVALVHSPELAEAAADAGVALYLTGHTHGGQICLPNGRPILTNSAAPRRYSSGRWRCGDMVGYTSTGLGVSGIPVRFNSRGEVALITLRRTG
jgi:predicted MPP superfamily phosphohydrolase